MNRSTVVPATLVDAVAGELARCHGLRSTVATRARLEAAIIQRARRCGLDPDRWVTSVATGPEELQAVVDLVTVQETSFFRDADHLEVLRWHVATHQAAPVVVWSAGCATGQEPYSIAFALDEAAVPDWRVVATDLSRTAVERTREGRYASEELRGLSAARRSRYLRPDGARWRVDDRIRERVTVIHHNLLTDPVPLGPGEGAAVFCRNVLIYVERHRIDGFLGRLRPRLRTGAALFVGGSESLPRIPDGYRLDRIGSTFVYRAEPAAAPSPPSRPAPVVSSPAEVPPHRRLRPEDPALVGRSGLTAVEEHRRSVCSDPDDPLAHLQLALALEAAGDLDAGRRAFRAALAALGRADPTAVEPRLEGYGIEALRSLLDAKVAEGGPR